MNFILLIYSPHFKPFIMNRSKLLPSFILLCITLILSSCNPIKDIFDLGMGFGIFIVLAILVLIIGIVMKLKKK